jgi:epoxyqueuosine reductase QueG
MHPHGGKMKRPLFGKWRRPEFCRRTCPQDAFRSGAFDRCCCLCQMWRDENAAEANAGGGISYCRICELACPVGK